MIAPLRRRTVVGGLLAVAVTVTGCAHTGQVAAKVGSATVSSGELATFTVDAQRDAGLAADPATVTTWQRKVLGYLVQRELWRAIAAREGLAVTPADVDAKLTQAAAAQTGGLEAIDKALAQEQMSEATIRPVLETLAIQDKFVEKAVQPSDADVQAAYDANIGTYRTMTVKHVAVATKQIADQLVTQISANPSSFDALAQANGATDTAALAPVTRPFSDFGAMGDAVWSAADGTVVDGQLNGGWHVFLVQGHQTKSFAEARATVLADIRSGQRGAVIGALLEKDKPGIGIEINPRFGVWDPAATNGASISALISETVVRAPDSTDAPTPTDTGAAG